MEMAPDLYRASIGHAQHCLRTLRSLLDKAQASSVSDTILQATLHDEMLPLAFHVHVVTVLCNKTGHWLCGKNPPDLPYELSSFQDCLGRLDQVQEYLNLATDASVEESRTTSIPVGVVAVGVAPIEMTGEDFIFDYLVPNITFHLTVVYSIMRMKGIQLGKLDFLGPFIGERLVEVEDEK